MNGALKNSSENQENVKFLIQGVYVEGQSSEQTPCPPLTPYGLFMAEALRPFKPRTPESKLLPCSPAKVY